MLVFIECLVRVVMVVKLYCYVGWCWVGCFFVEGFNLVVVVLVCGLVWEVFVIEVVVWWYEFLLVVYEVLVYLVIEWVVKVFFDMVMLVGLVVVCDLLVI